MSAAAWLLFASLIPLLAVISVYVSHKRAATRLRAAGELYNITEDRYYKIFELVRPPQLWKQTAFPIFVMFLISLYGAQLTIETSFAVGVDIDRPEDASNPVKPPEAGPGPQHSDAKLSVSNLLMLGSTWQQSTKVEQARSYRINTFVAIAFAYVGWYIWAIATIFSRLATLELVAATYMNMVIRLIMALVLAIVFRHLGATFFGIVNPVSPIAIGFGVGIFPDSALTSITRRLRRQFLGEGEEVDDMPLDLIQGISAFRKLRLYELGMDNCQNLAASNPILLFLTSNLSLLEVIDWVGQAQFAVLVGSANFAKLQANGWRTAEDFSRACGSAARPVLARLIGYDELQLDDLRAGLLCDPNFERINGLRARVRNADKADKMGQMAPPDGMKSVVGPGS